MIRIAATSHVRPDAVEELHTLTGKLVEASRAENGNLAYDLYMAKDDSASFVIFETWRSNTATEIHNASVHFTTLVPRTASLCAELPSVIRYTEV